MKKLEEEGFTWSEKEDSAKVRRYNTFKKERKND